jgi:hypothetical protein
MYVPTMKQAILIVGTGRSGTSAMTGVLKILGSYLGEELKPGDAVNPKGYFENTQLANLNKEALSAAGISWYGPPPDPDVVHPVPVTSARSASIRDCVARIFGERSPIAFKDPRLCVLIDAYTSTLRDMGYEVHCVRMTRDPSLVAKSIAVAAGADESHWLPMVRRRADLLDDALRRTAVDCVDCTFDDLIKRTRSTVFEIVERLPFLSCSTEIMNEVLAFIDGSLRHHG